MNTPKTNLAPNKLALAIISTLVLSNFSHARGPDLPVEFLGGDFTVEGMIKNGAQRQNDGGNSLNIDLGFNALGFAGEMTINAITKASQSDIYEFKYGNRLEVDKSLPNGGKNIEIYDFTATHIGDDFDINLFYHIPRYHWGYEGDAFGLMRETTNMPDQDQFNAKAPAGVEFVGKNALDGLKVVGGKQIYWGAEPMVMAKYQFGQNDQYAFIASSDTSDDSNKQQYSLQGQFDLSDTTKLDLAFLRSGYEKAGDSYLYDDGAFVYSDTVSSSDANAYKIRVTEKFSGGVSAYAEFNYAGLVANAGEHQEIWTTNIPYSELGNKKTLELTAEILNGNWMFKPRAFSRRNLVDALSVEAQNLNSVGRRVTSAVTTTDLTNLSPFSVTGNRAVDSLELFATYDTTPGTYFYEWDNYLKEDAPLAFNVGFTVSKFKGRTDSAVFGYIPLGGTDLVDWTDTGRPAEIQRTLEGRLVVNPTDTIRLNMNFSAGQQVPFANNIDITDFASVSGTVVHQSKNVYSFKLARDAYGEYDYHENFGTSYPWQAMVGYERMLDWGAGNSKAGIKATKRTLNAEPDQSEISAYLTYSF